MRVVGRCNASLANSVSHRAVVTTHFNIMPNNADAPRIRLRYMTLLGASPLPLNLSCLRISTISISFR